MRIDPQIPELIRQLAGTEGLARVYLIDAEVVSVDKDARTCIVNSLDKKNLDNVKVRISPDLSDGEFNFPEIGSTISVIFSSFSEPYVLATTWLDEKYIVIGNQGYFVQNGSQKFNDGSYGGIPIVKDPDNSNSGLLKKINQLENKYNDLVNKYNSLISTFNSHTHIYSPGPLTPIATATPLPTSSATETIISQITSESDISNPNITHGKDIKQQ